MHRTPHKIYKKMPNMQQQGQRIQENKKMCEIDNVKVFLQLCCEDCEYDEKEDIPRCRKQLEILETKEIGKFECNKRKKYKEFTNRIDKQCK